MKIDSIMNRQITIAQGPNKNLIIEEINDLQKLIDILQQTKVLQGYPTYDSFCLPVIELINYYVNPGIIPAIAFTGSDGAGSYSICSATSERAAYSKEKLGEIGFVLEYMSINKGNECVLHDYLHIRSLGEKAFSVQGEQGPAIDLYCLYGDKYAGSDFVHEEL